MLPTRPAGDTPPPFSGPRVTPVPPMGGCHKGKVRRPAVHRRTRGRSAWATTRPSTERAACSSTVTGPSSTARTRARRQPGRARRPARTPRRKAPSTARPSAVPRGARYRIGSSIPRIADTDSARGEGGKIESSWVESGRSSRSRSIRLRCVADLPGVRRPVRLAGAGRGHGPGRPPRRPRSSPG